MRGEDTVGAASGATRRVIAAEGAPRVTMAARDARPAPSGSSSPERSRSCRPRRDSARSRRADRRRARADARARRRAGDARRGGRSASSASSSSSPARGPCTIAAAIAWFSATIGLSDMRFEHARRARGSAASRCPRRARLRRARPRSPPAADRRRPTPFDSVAVDERDAFGDRVAVPQRAILLVERDQLAVRRRCARRGARRSAASARAGRRLRRRRGSSARTARVRRIASSERSVRCSAAPPLAV